MAYVLPFQHEIHSGDTEPQPSFIARAFDWLGQRMEKARAAEVERYLAGAANERELSQRLHRLEQESHSFHV